MLVTPAGVGCARSIDRRMRFRIWENTGMDTKPAKGPHPWLGVGLAAAGLVVSIIWIYLQVRHWKEPQADYAAMSTTIFVTLVLWVVLCFAVWRNLTDARREKTLRAYIHNLEDEHKLQVGNEDTALPDVENYPVPDALNLRI